MTATRCAEDHVVEARRAYMVAARVLARSDQQTQFAPRYDHFCALQADAASIDLDLANAQASEARLRAGVPT